jgi:hypothetical protein
MPNDSASGHARSIGLTEDEKLRSLHQIQTSRNRSQSSNNADRTNAADHAATVAGYLRALSGKSIAKVAQRCGLAQSTLERLESGEPTHLTPGQETALSRVFGVKANDLKRPLTDVNKARALHGLPFPEEEA